MERYELIVFGIGSCNRFDRSQPVQRSVGGIRYRPYVPTCESVDQVDWIPERSPDALALDGRLSLVRRVPTPKIDSAPPSSDATVQAGMWFWTDTPFEPKSVTAWVPGPDGAVWATAAATPARLVVDPGDGRLGTGPVVCDGPGEPWLPEYGDERARCFGQLIVWHVSAGDASACRRPRTAGVV